MHRKKFLALSGASLAGLLISPNLFEDMPGGDLLALPDEIWIESGNQLVSLLNELIWFLVNGFIMIRQAERL